ncbi:hypothetical protein F8M41_013686 [Gigaspora margarita]|uniref:Uncharacterized protein n=1 Tax=Gigaspora margarita TaxID=4874 RepID=A0A8H3WYC5_GIGMA|nr:hypothetical protein F8M41_013686 [Gigaspora margarita]
MSLDNINFGNSYLITFERDYHEELREITGRVRRSRGRGRGGSRGRGKGKSKGKRDSEEQSSVLNLELPPFEIPRYPILIRFRIIINSIEDT